MVMDSTLRDFRTSGHAYAGMLARQGRHAAALATAWRVGVISAIAAVLPGAVNEIEINNLTARFGRRWRVGQRARAVPTCQIIRIIRGQGQANRLQACANTFAPSADARYSLPVELPL
jgi:hypothetical protein